MPVFAYGALRQGKQRNYYPAKYVRNLFDGTMLSKPQPWLLGLEKTSR